MDSAGDRKEWVPVMISAFISFNFSLFSSLNSAIPAYSVTTKTFTPVSLNASAVFTQVDPVADATTAYFKLRFNVTL